MGYIRAMSVMARRLRIYETKNGKAPFAKWLEGLDRPVRARIDKRLDRLRRGNLGDVKPVGGGVIELREAFGPGYRIYFGQDGEKIVILLLGGDKSDQRADIKTAQS